MKTDKPNKKEFDAVLMMPEIRKKNQLGDKGHDL